MADVDLAKRAVRAAVVVPATFALARVVGEAVGTPRQAGEVEIFAAFGSIALLLLTDFPGRPLERLRAYLVLVATGSVLIVLGTLFSINETAATASMAVSGFVILFAGVTSRRVAAGTVAALLTFVLPVALPGHADVIGARLAGWGLAAALAIPAVMLVWAPPFRDAVREQLARAARALAAVATGRAAGRLDPVSLSRAAAEMERLEREFEATVSRPTTGSAGDIAIPKLFGRIQWAAANALDDQPQASTLDLPQVRRTHQAAAAVLEGAAALLRDERPEAGPELGTALTRLEESRSASQASALRRLLHRALDAGRPAPDGQRHERVLGVIDPTFRSRAFGFAAQLVGEASLEAAGLDVSPHGTVQPRTGRWRTAWRMALRTAASHLDPGSVWLRNSIRGAVGLALAVAIVEATDLQHGFWVVLGTMSVLRSNAVGTTATAFQAVTGTVAGFLAGALVLLVLGPRHYELLWFLLPVAVFVAAYVPTAISFTAGQAAFTLVVLVLFNILEPAGVRIGVTRVENVAIGGAVSLGVGLLLWPRGAAAALGRALCEAYLAAGRYLQAAVDRLCSPYEESPTEDVRRATEPAFGRLDDAFRQYLAERGTRPVAVETMTALATGAVRTRLAAHSLAGLANLPHRRHRDVSDAALAASRALQARCRTTNEWYGQLAAVLAGRQAATAEPPAGNGDVQRLALILFDEARAGGRIVEVRTALRILWADEALDDEAVLQTQLAIAARAFAERPRLASPSTWLRTGPQIGQPVGSAP